MKTLTQSTPLGTLGLPSGDHWVKFHVEGDSISFEVAASVPAKANSPAKKKPAGFVQKWSGTAKKIEDAGDTWLAHINEKHLR
ncbi:MAG TPA: hypothetical protein DIT64_18730 [Verrucomicrobiales bacterium]|nr:hypothetical protein [Verrucomicrobiales bacterium]HRJ08592.1 hypothetical protein [Prosthecobacter sp.]HRK16164.1 hypothetical protein [Prosthecobacter sp.]